MKQTLSLTRKELDGYFSSPMAIIFVGVFLVVTLFTFFWVDEFFVRGIANVRPLFRWMPILMIFLIAALTMRSWSEEEQSGTLEILLTLPMRIPQLVLGKFLAVLTLVVITLALTLFLPISVSMMGNLDTGPVIGGYLAAILMASAYIAIGLFMSSRTDNQIVSLILTVIVCGLLHLVGSLTMTSLVDADTAEILRAFGTGSRFESIERGVIDLRDMLYYLSLTAIFLGLNIVSLDSKRWSRGARTQSYRFNRLVTMGLVIANLIVFNSLLFSFRSARLDLTEDKEYSLSPITKDLLQDLQEPLLIRGYFSQENHPLLEPLIPRIRDMLDEYQVVAGNNLNVEFIDPADDPELEAEANQTYGIRSIPFQTTGHRSTSIINAYFDILIRYGDQSVVLTVYDLVEEEAYGDDVQVQLGNLEYDLTSSIQKVVFGFQSLDTILESLNHPAKLTLYVTPDTLPADFEDAPQTIESVAREIEAQSNGKFTFESVNVVTDPTQGVTPDQLFDTYQMQALTENPFAADYYYLHMVVEAGNMANVIYPDGRFSETEIRTTIESALKRLTSGFLPVVGYWVPPDTPQQNPLNGQMIPSLKQYTMVLDGLRQNYEVRSIDLESGSVPTDIDVLFVIGPQNMSDRAKYAIDQYVMRGGSLMVAAGNYNAVIDPFGMSLVNLEPVEGGLGDMLAHYGITVEPSLVLDVQNELFLILEGEEPVLVNHPQFVDVRSDGMDDGSLIVSNLSAVTMNWVSPITPDKEKGLKVINLLKSTSQSWTSTNLDTQPAEGFFIEGEQKSRVLAVAVEGRFESFFKGQPSPLEVPAEPTPDPMTGQIPPVEEQETTPLAGTIEQSPQNTRIVVFGSTEFLNDTMLSVSRDISGSRYLSNIQLIQNSVDWFTEDTSLASIRSRGTAMRILNDMDEEEQQKWEVANYVVALMALVVLGGVWWIQKYSEQPMDLVPLEELQNTSEEGE